MNGLLPFRPAHALTAVAEDRRWLIDGLWAAEAVGIVGGEPKCCKSFLALDMAVAVASGAPCLGRFAPVEPGRVLLFAAEDALHVVRRRLAETVEHLRPRLLILDPFVRLHRIDENVSGEVAPLLAYLRELQRRHAVAVVLVHHARKGAGKARAGQALRGSSEFHAWGDSNLYLRRHGDDLVLTVEHRAAPSTSGIHVALKGDGAALALRVVDAPVIATANAPSAVEKIERALGDAATPLTIAALRAACHIRNKNVALALATLSAEGRVRKTAAGYMLASR